MSSPEYLDRVPIESLYRQKTPNETILLGQFLMSRSDHAGSDVGSISGEARLRFTPSDSLDIFVPPTSHTSHFRELADWWTRSKSDDVTINFLEYGSSAKVFLSSASSEGYVYHPKQSPVQVRPPSTSISRAVFHLLNWPDFHGPDNYVLRTGTGPHYGAVRCGRIVVEVDCWTVTVVATPETRELTKLLKESGGHVITHVGLIQRTDGKEFSTESLDEFMTFLLYYFSFVLGRWSGPSLCVGFDTSEARVYENWGLGQCTGGAWNGSQSWFDKHHAEFIAAAMPGFWKLWSSNAWNESLKDAIYWYIAANQAGSSLGVDSAMLFTQAALELLSWTHCVLDQKMLSEHAFKPRGLNAADKLRLLVRSLGLPAGIPNNLSSIKGRPGSKWNDSMEAIVDIRNGLVHPGINKNVTGDTYYESWKLSMWYLDIILLRLCEYRGKYSNRLEKRSVGEVQSVPWN